MSVLDINQIKELLPHRYPFLLLDRVVECVPGQTLRAIKNVTINEPFFAGHFPGKPLMPGVLIIEAMAQAAAILGELSGAVRHSENRLYYLVGVDNARFRKPVEPGDQLAIEIRLQAVRRNIWRFSGTTRVDGALIASADFLTTVSESNP
ncbi:MAG: 3-hydroxyacyl-ACP dehydratase FabZ [Gammaproteobacteria bacterium]|nr:3-hydroxyacyl-ACP dehydratase FabZ [Gammaproteobacteria bacterium]